MDKTTELRESLFKDDDFKRLSMKMKKARTTIKKAAARCEDVQRRLLAVALESEKANAEHKKAAFEENTIMIEQNNAILAKRRDWIRVDFRTGNVNHTQIELMLSSFEELEEIINMILAKVSGPRELNCVYTSVKHLEYSATPLLPLLVDHAANMALLKAILAMDPQAMKVWIYPSNEIVREDVGDTIFRLKKLDQEKVLVFKDFSQ
jgi:hypothetical protein